jgi:hypothetical protein
MTLRTVCFKPSVTLLLCAATLCLFDGILAYGQADAPGIFHEMSPGLLGRTVFKADASDFRIEIMDILVGPGKKSESIALKGGALLDVQGGEVTLIVDGKRRRVRAGDDAVSLAQGQTIIIDNSSVRRSLVARLILFSRL